MAGCTRFWSSPLAGLRLPAGLRLFASGLALALVAGPALAVDLSVSPKRTKTITVSAEDKASPKTIKYKLQAENGAKVGWRLKRYPKWLVPEATSGKAKRKPAKLRLTVKTSKVRKLKPGIYSSAIRFTYGTEAAKRAKLRRTVVLIVEGDATAGRDLFTGSCSGCHDLYQNTSGPFLLTVYGRAAGTAAGFDYSDALVAYGEVWQEENLDAWLTNSQKLVPGARMYMKLRDPADRMNIIAYLKSISP